ncbi:hypothetical protein ACJQWL_12485, partial [Lysobacter sp. A3-1-A15]
RGGRKLAEGETAPATDAGTPTSPGQPAAAPPAARRAGPTQVNARKAGAAATAAQPGSSDKPGLLGRIGRGLKSLVTRAPRSQH